MDSEESTTPDPSTTPSTPTTQDVPGVPKQGLERSSLVTGSRVQIVSGALVATCIVFLSSLSGEEPLDTWLTVALFAFAVAIPALAAEFIVATYRFIPQSQWEQWSTSSLLFTGRILADAIGQIGAFVGIIAFVGHFNAVAAIVMALTIPAVLIIWSGGVIVEAVYDGTRNLIKNRPAKSAEQDAATARAGVEPSEQTRTDT
jgi:hypothetical protein